MVVTNPIPKKNETLIINTESPTTSACGLNVEDFLVYPFNPRRIPMLLSASGTSIFARRIWVSN